MILRKSRVKGVADLVEGWFQSGMAKLEDIVKFLDENLRTGEIPDYAGAHNGLQFQNRGEVTKVAVAVDASLSVIQAAVEQGADLLLVHHGLFWQGVHAVTGAWYEKYRLALEGNLAIYSSHLPLDVHPEWGNNVGLSRALELGDGEPFFDWKGICLGRMADGEGTVGGMKEKLERVLGGRVHLRGREKDQVGKVGVITGGAGSEVEAVAKEGVNTFVTGEGPHWSFPLAEELGLIVLYGGHYATETFGVKALGAAVKETFQVPWNFIDRPSGL